jgi:hypothetical protein
LVLEVQDQLLLIRMVYLVWDRPFSQLFQLLVVVVETLANLEQPHHPVVLVAVVLEAVQELQLLSHSVATTVVGQTTLVVVAVEDRLA